MGRHKGYTVADYQRMADDGMTLSEAAAAMEVARQTVWAFAKRHGIAFTRGSKGRPKRTSLDEQTSL